jgi:hypothetical protein
MIPTIAVLMLLLLLMQTVLLAVFPSSLESRGRFRPTHIENELFD